MSIKDKAKEITRKHIQVYCTGELGIGDTVYNAVTEALESQRLKLFVWEDVLIDYSSGLMVAVASSVEEARAQLRNADRAIPEDDLKQEPLVFDLTVPATFVCWGGG